MQKLANFGGAALCASLFLLPAAATGAEPLPFAETIVVSGEAQSPGLASFETRHALGSAEIGLLAAGSADQILRRLPSVHVPVNSRGEAIAFVRNAGERQVAVFYEGAAINVPWDNRLDLSLLPAGLVGSASMAAGPLAPHYGVNAIGALSLSPRADTHAQAVLGNLGLFEGEAAVSLGPVTLGGSYATRDAEAVSDDAEVPFSQSSTEARTNTDRQLASLFARVEGRAGPHDLSLTAFHVWGDKGIAPESNRAAGARFWRYPEIRHTLVAARATSMVGADTELSSALWYQRFGQTIDNYANATYDRVTLRQIDADETWGVRELLSHDLGAARLVGSFNFLSSTHRQRDIPLAAGSPPATPTPRLVYSQQSWSIGGEVEYQFSERLRGELGLGYDRVNFVRTGDKPPVKDASDWTGRAALAYALDEGWLLRAAAGRKMRAPTMRERFGEAIGRFLINPDLKPERIVTFEFGAEWRGDNASVFAIPFVQNLSDTIDQRNVGRLRQRINLPGSTVQGLELGGAWNLEDHLSVSGEATWTRVRRKHPLAGQVNRIAEKPSLLARLRVHYEHPSGLSSRLEAEHVGRAYSADPDGFLVPLERSTSLNWRLAYAVEMGSRRWELFGHIENLTDTFIEPQLGLPAPGRTLRLGVRTD